ncbi:hypothetical protein [Agaribacterium sp. ZY112]|uniref:hypothetical protein n=1 Tax=Agaribacterium sp. ZY112 TaxID=3233574 RepID=UPI003523339D
MFGLVLSLALSANTCGVELKDLLGSSSVSVEHSGDGPSLHVYPVDKYLDSTYVVGESIHVTARFDAGNGNVVSKSANGVKFSLLRVNDQWDVFSEIVIHDRAAIGKQRGVAKASIPLSGVIPSPELPSEQFYLLYAEYTASNGEETKISGIAPIFIVKETALVDGWTKTITSSIRPDKTSSDDANVPFFRIDSPEKYTNELYVIDEPIRITSHFDVGEGNFVSSHYSGIKYYLRHVDSNWHIISDTVVFDKRVIGKQAGVSSVLIPLDKLSPSTELPEGELYFIYAQLVSSDGVKFDIPGITPITVLKERASEDDPLARGESTMRSGLSAPPSKVIIIASGSLTTEAFFYETRSKSRRCEDISSYSSPKLYSRTSIELLLICQAFRAVDTNVAFKFISAPNYSRALELVKNGSAHLMAESTWEEDIDEQYFYSTEPIIRKGEYFKGIYTTEENLEKMEINSVEDLRAYTALTPTNWSIDVETLISMGVTNRHAMQVPQAVLKMIHSGRGDYTLSDFTKQHRMAITDGEENLYPVAGVKVRLPSERRFIVSKKSDPEGEIFSMLEQGVKKLRKDGSIERALHESGFINSDIEGWKVINE